MKQKFSFNNYIVYFFLLPTALYPMAASAKKELRAQLQTIRALIEKINLRDRKHAAAYLAIDKKFEQFGKVSHEFFYPLPLPNYNDAKTQELQQLLNKPFSSEDELITKLSLLIHEGADINQTFNNQTPLTWAMCKDHLKIIDFLLNHDAHIDCSLFSIDLYSASIMRLLLAKLVSKNINETEDNFLSNFFEILSSIPSKQIKKFMEITKDFLKELETTLQQHTYNDSYPTIPTIKTENFKDKINAHTNRISLWTGLFVHHITKQKNG